ILQKRVVFRHPGHPTGRPAGLPEGTTRRSVRRLSGRNPTARPIGM
ncbi:uncharacterized protein METZ01_LOCUS458975, partial [marine metagenome]